MIKTSHREDERAPGSWLMTPTPTRPESSAGLTCCRGDGQAPPRWLYLALGAGKWTAWVPAVVLAPSPLLHAFNHSFYPAPPFAGHGARRPGYGDDRSGLSPCPHRVCNLEEETDVHQAIAQVVSANCKL